MTRRSEPKNPFPPANPGRGQREAARNRAEEVARAWREFPGKGVDGVYRNSVRGEDVVITDIQEGYDEQASWVDVYMGGHVPAFRICNPPTLVDDPRGDVEIPETREDGKVVTKKYRKDPLGAVSHVIADVRGKR